MTESQPVNGPCRGLIVALSTMVVFSCGCAALTLWFWHWLASLGGAR